MHDSKQCCKTVQYNGGTFDQADRQISSSQWYTFYKDE